MGSGVKGVAGRDAIVQKRRRNSSQEATQHSHKETVARRFPLFFRVLRRNYCTIVAQQLKRTIAQTIASLPVTPFTPTPIPLLRVSFAEQQSQW